MRSKSATKSEIALSLITTTLCAFFIVGALYYLLGNWAGIPFGFWELWSTPTHSEGLLKVWFIFAWGLGVTFLVTFQKPPNLATSSEECLIDGAWISILAGVFEEILFRWLGFFGAIIFLKILDIVLFGLVEWFYTTIAIPVANFLTLGAMESILYGPYAWTVAAGVIMANGRFMNGHKHLGLVGFINSWFIGMVFFWLVFNYGLMTAIVAHIVYNLCIFWTIAACEYFKGN